MLPNASEFFKERLKSVNLTDSIVTTIARIMEDYAELKLEEYKKTQELIEFYDEDFVNRIEGDFQNMHHFQNGNNDDPNPDGPSICHFPDP